MELVGTTVKESVGQGAADTLVKVDEHQSNPDAFFGELVGVSGSVRGEQGMGFELAQVITELGQVSGLSWKVERRAWWIWRERHPLSRVSRWRQQDHRTKNRWRSKFQICLGRSS